MDKGQLRKEYKEKRKQLSIEESGRMSKLIAGHVMDFLKSHAEWKHVHLFLPIKKNREVDTFPVLDFLQTNQYRVYTSSIHAVSGEMVTVDISEEKEFVENAWGIPEASIQKVVSSDAIQLVLVPLLVVDKYGHRLGYGKGHYDKFFKSLSQPVFKLGLSFFAPVDRIGEELHDVALDACVFPEGILKF